MKYSAFGPEVGSRGGLLERTGFRAAAAVVAGSLLVAGAGVAHADTIYNTLDDSIDATAEVMPLIVGGTAGSTTLKVAPATDDGKNGCNLAGNSKPTLVLNLGSSNSAVATVSPSSVTFESCGDLKTLTVTPVAQGTTTISATQVSNTSEGSFDLSPATFTVNVSAPTPSNTAPTVSVTGVSATSYNKGSVPTATCVVTDPEDKPAPFPAALSGITGPYASDGIGQQTATCAYRDNGGLYVQESVSYSITDPTAPVISYTVDPVEPPADANGWYRSQVQLTWNVAEPDSSNSMVTDGCEDQTISADQLATSYSCSATSAGGSAAQQTVTLKKDGTLPTVAYTSAAGTRGGADWYRSAVEALFTGTDVTSGLDQPTASALSEGEGADVKVLSPAFKDRAGNTAAAGAISQSFKIDLTAPFVSFDEESVPAPNASGWYTNDVVAKFIGSDLLSGLKGLPTQSVTSAGEGSAVAVKSPVFEDVAGNTSAEGAAEASFKIDKTAPAVTFDAAGTPAPNAEGWYNSDVPAKFDASDVVSGVKGPATLTVPSSGESTLTSNNDIAPLVVKSPVFEDVAGNSSAAGAAEATFKVDKTKPVVTFDSAKTAEANGEGWYNTDVEAFFTGSDALSGLATAAEQKVTSEGEGRGVQVTSPVFKDKADNTETATATFNIDKTKPTVVFDSTLGDSFFGSVPSAPTCTASDNLSGPQSCVVSGHKTTVGTHILTATATDKAGNVETATQSYTVKAWTTKGFYQPIDMNGVVNTVKGGSTVPAKFEVFIGDVEVTNPTKVDVQAKRVSCEAGAATAPLEMTTAGSTSLRYDATAGQFVYNWKTPVGAGSCYQLTMTANDGSSITANFMMK